MLFFVTFVLLGRFPFTFSCLGHATKKLEYISPKLWEYTWLLSKPLYPLDYLPSPVVLLTTPKSWISPHFLSWWQWSLGHLERYISQIYSNPSQIHSNLKGLPLHFEPLELKSLKANSSFCKGSSTLQGNFAQSLVYFLRVIGYICKVKLLLFY